MKASSIRARVRAEMTDEIKTVARRHLATDGANLSLRAVARDMGMVSSALYRYFASRDDLLTALIIDAYNALGAAVEGAESIVTRMDLRGRWLAVCHAVREWALANPAEYALVYGSPVPGYVAPMDTVEPAHRTAAVLMTILRDGIAAGVLHPDPGDHLPPTVRTELRVISDLAFPGLPVGTLNRGMTGWIQLFGIVSFELFGRFNNTIEARAEYFDHQMQAMADLIGVP
jgi:AcrR family transcriptional regulator